MVSCGFRRCPPFTQVLVARESACGVEARADERVRVVRHGVESGSVGAGAPAVADATQDGRPGRSLGAASRSPDSGV